MLEFNKKIIDAVKGTVPAVKVQSAFYEQYGPAGVRAFLDTADYAKGKGLIVIGDLKRNDIGNTSVAYSSAYIGKSMLFDSREPAFGLDAITVNPYLGSDGITPFLDDVKRDGKGIFVLVKTSNPSSAEIQDLAVGKKKVYEAVAELVNKWGESLRKPIQDYSPVGAVVGATYPEEAARLRKMMPHAMFLVPGYGAQGGGANDIIPCFNKDGYGAIVNSSRGIIFAYQKTGKEEGFVQAAEDAAIRMKLEIERALKKEDIYPW